MTDLQVRQLSVSYGGILAVRGISFEIGRGRILALVGPNGSGKSSTARAIMGLVPASGEVSIEGRSILRLTVSERARLGIGFVPEGRGTFGPLSVKENILLGGYCASAAERSRRFDDVCGMFPVLGRRLAQAANSLSGGEQQMLAVARALMIGPSILICDEPSMGLAPAVCKTLFSAFRTIANRGTAVLIGDQNAKFLFGISDDVCVMRLGSIVARGRPDQFKSDSNLAEHYFGSPSGEAVASSNSKSPRETQS